MTKTPPELHGVFKGVALGVKGLVNKSFKSVDYW
jgi:hypothetical protein